MSWDPTLSCLECCLRWRAKGEPNSLYGSRGERYRELTGHGGPDLLTRPENNAGKLGERFRDAEAQSG